MTRLSGVLGQVRYLIVSIPDLCVLSYFTNVIATHERAVVFGFFFQFLAGVGVPTKRCGNYKHKPIARRTATVSRF